MEASCESCGWAAAACAMLLSGSFGVPIKSETCRRLDIDPMVFQTYKTVVCFLVAGVSLWLLDHPFHFTPWGIVSGLFWIPGGVGTVMSIKLAGLAIATAVGNSCIALVSFTWGIFIFREPIHSKIVACLGVCMMVFGFSGMSYFSTRPKSAETTAENSKHDKNSSNINSEQKEQQPTKKISRQLPTPSNSGYSKASLASTTSHESVDTIDHVEEARIQAFEPMQGIKVQKRKDFSKSSNHYNSTAEEEQHQQQSRDDDNEAEMASDENENNNINQTDGAAGLRHRQSHHLQHHANESYPATPHHSKAFSSSSSTPPIIPLVNKTPDYIEDNHQSFIVWVPQSTIPEPTDIMLHLGDWKITRRQAGIMLAVFNGCWGGSVMVPMKFCPDHTITSGIGYAWSFSIGALIVNAGLWVFRYMWMLVDTKSLRAAYHALPSFHVRQMWLPGGIAGLLWSIGNLFSTLSVDYLGEGVGYCVVQASMLG